MNYAHKRDYIQNWRHQIEHQIYKWNHPINSVQYSALSVIQNRISSNCHQSPANFLRKFWIRPQFTKHKEIDCAKNEQLSPQNTTFMTESDLLLNGETNDGTNGMMKAFRCRWMHTAYLFTFWICNVTGKTWMLSEMCSQIHRKNNEWSDAEHLMFLSEQWIHCAIPQFVAFILLFFSLLLDLLLFFSLLL